MSVDPERLRGDYGDLTAEEQARLDGAAGEAGVGVMQLMEIAGWQVARWVFALCGGGREPLLVVAGRGNNGGDGLVAARHLRTWGAAVEVALVAEVDSLGELGAVHLAAVRSLGVPVHAVPGGDLPPSLVDRAALVVDALLGTGARGDPRPAQAEAIRRLPAGRTVSVDVPSGLDASSGVPGDPTVRAVQTCTLTAMKRGLWSAAGREHAGEVTVADIGMPSSAWSSARLRAPALVRGGVLLRVP